MIKTMLLTAQVALSPIVGTNGLQPKYLPNPVYGESVDYSVKYRGNNYTRLGYLDEQTKWEATLNESGNLTFAYKGISFTGNGYLNSNIGSGDAGELHCSIYKQEEVTIHDFSTAFCVSFYSYYYDGESNIMVYVEIFSDDESNLETLYYAYDTLGAKWEFDQTTNNETTFEYDFTQVANNAQKLQANVPNCTIGKITQDQPTTANPSVYDNIYNFYYQNLFANEALDELGAKVGNNSLTMRQWLAHTATIVSISLLAAALVFLVIKIFKLIAGSISDIWG